ncbi:hypothetical protein NDU88_001185 [Pleurodeles waltl]|uniref:Uncharacterized protein n=1 Tax=Pleurodeles waltl TaxID=8319 RepID=A0AAV7SA51_PLEWA|nr:hypothetical protein NDU88_001185 [Pleurodeles waltl]
MVLCEREEGIHTILYEWYPKHLPVTKKAMKMLKDACLLTEGDLVRQPSQFEFVLKFSVEFDYRGAPDMSHDGDTLCVPSTETV